MLNHNSHFSWTSIVSKCWLVSVWCTFVQPIFVFGFVHWSLNRWRKSQFISNGVKVSRKTVYLIRFVNTHFNMLAPFWALIPAHIPNGSPLICVYVVTPTINSCRKHWIQRPVLHRKLFTDRHRMLPATESPLNNHQQLSSMTLTARPWFASSRNTWAQRLHPQSVQRCQAQHQDQQQRLRPQPLQPPQQQHHHQPHQLWHQSPNHRHLLRQPFKI